ncbi:DNA-binding transcriptional regulator, MarR family [Jatrophihabitans endophyticus]|uniref:DNA-binding transcriptional regulator, MarR family n=1 Tax=Jatrophihabitans endophyticus TaxID=1206085 RepID=A0A1M5MMR6_9ACTN|nr:MarR family transcriptional regulator [Jatrophihabitans endophyticus]SHG78073.1 DNA-binding transcriptional regulator, MarR family [Jatrophihabitans endophyticus]
MADRDAELEALTNAFWTVARRLRHGSRQTLAPFDLAPSHSRALGTLLRRGAMRLGALADLLGIAARSATEVVDALEERGLVERTPDPSDRRATLVVPTDEGRELMLRIREARLAETDELFARLSAQDRAELTRMLLALDE